MRAGPYLYTALPASTAIQSRAKSICLTKDDILLTTVWATFSTTLGSSRMILNQPKGKVPEQRYNRGHVAAVKRGFSRGTGRDEHRCGTDS